MCRFTEGTEPRLNNSKARVILLSGVIPRSTCAEHTMYLLLWYQPKGPAGTTWNTPVSQWTISRAALGPLGDISSIWSISMFHWQVETSLNKYGNAFKSNFNYSSHSSSIQTLPKCQVIEWDDSQHKAFFLFLGLYISVTHWPTQRPVLVVSEITWFGKENLHPVSLPVFWFSDSSFYVSIAVVLAVSVSKTTKQMKEENKAPSHPSSGRDLCCRLYGNLWTTPLHILTRSVL